MESIASINQQPQLWANRPRAIISFSPASSEEPREYEASMTLIAYKYTIVLIFTLPEVIKRSNCINCVKLRFPINVNSLDVTSAKALDYTNKAKIVSSSTIRRRIKFT